MLVTPSKNASSSSWSPTTPEDLIGKKIQTRRKETSKKRGKCQRRHRNAQIICQLLCTTLLVSWASYDHGLCMPFQCPCIVRVQTR